MRVSLCLLVWNEIDGCKIDIPKIPYGQFDEVYAVDGGSDDGTVAYLEFHGIPVYRQPKKGLNAAYIHAVDMSTYDAVVIFFPKGTSTIEDLLKFRPLLEAGYDVVIASRNIKGGRNEEDDRFLKLRKWSVLALAILAALIWRREGYFVRDVLQGFKGFTVSAFRQIAPLDYGLSIDIEMIVRSYRLHLKRVEFPTKERHRPFGKTHFRLFPTGLKLIKYLWHEAKRGD